MKGITNHIVEKGGGDKVMRDIEEGEDVFRTDNERECKERGQLYVRGHYTRKGEWVRGYCRNRRK